MVIFLLSLPPYQHGTEEKEAGKGKKRLLGRFLGQLRTQRSPSKCKHSQLKQCNSGAAN